MYLIPKIIEINFFDLKVFKMVSYTSRDKISCDHTNSAKFTGYTVNAPVCHLWPTYVYTVY